MDSISDKTKPAYKYEIEKQAVCTVPIRRHAITVRHARIQYKDVLSAIISGGGPSTNIILKDFNMTIEKGHIYGLLGASGCGKTSLLRAIVGQHDLTAGEIRVLGHRPKTPESGIPGTTVGYMPQELCLLEEFTIRESLYFYGKLGGMSSDEIHAKCDYFVKFLELPKPNRIVGTLSGGQRRRVSFAIALLHSPPVLILDEPTVGVDPLLRESIWEYLTKLAKSNGTTVLITTHYIEEASQADTVGLMRNGKLMAEESPCMLMQTLQCNTLEDVLLKLCVLQSMRKLSISSVNDALDLPVLSAVNDEDEDFTTEAPPVRSKVTPLQRLRVLAWKDSVLNIRHYVFLLIMAILPVICMILFCLSFGGTPTRLKISIFNQESNCLSMNNETTKSYGVGLITNCEMPPFLSCKVIEMLEDKGIVLPEVSDSERSAENDVRRGRSWAAMTFSKNFTYALMERAKYSLNDVKEDTIVQGTIQVAMDQSDRIVSNLLQQHMASALKRVLAEVNAVCHNLRHVKDLPMQFKEPIYGGAKSGILDTVLPGAITSVILMFPCAMTLATLLPGKIQGTLERGLIAGVKMSEVIVSLFLVCLIPSLFITAGAVIIPYIIFGITMSGSYWTMAGIVIPLMIAGMLLGFVIALLCKTMTAALLFSMFFWFSCIFTSGSMWPIQGAFPLARPIFWAFPLTLPSDAIRHIAVKGWTICFKSLQITLASIGLWSLAYILMISAILKFN